MACTTNIIITVHVLLFVYQVHGLENLALRKPTWEQNPWPNNPSFRTENAVDGKYTDRSSTGGQCTISNDGRNTAEWRVDLGSVCSISRIDIYYRSEGIRRFNIIFSFKSCKKKNDLENH